MTDWYVSPSGTNNTTSGTTTSPWQTITYALGRSTVINGDTLWLSSGTYRETINGKTGVNIRALPGANAIISACDSITNWSLVDSEKNIWSSNDMTWTLNNVSNPAGNDLIFKQGEALPEARWPHIPLNKKLWSLSREDWAQAIEGIDTGGNSVANNQIVTGTFTCNELNQLSGINLIGTRITFISGSQWVSIGGTVTSSTNNTITFTFPNRQGNDYRLTNGGHFFLFGTYNLMGENEWYRDSNTGVLYLRLPIGESPKGIEAKRRVKVIELWDISSILIKDISIRGGSINTSSNSHDIKVINCDIRYGRHRLWYGTWWEYEGFVLLLQGNNCQVVNCNIINSSSTAIGVLGNSCNISYCSVRDVGYIGGDASHINCENGGNYTITNNSFIGNGSSNSIRFARIINGGVISNNRFGITGRLITDAGIVMLVKNTNPSTSLLIRDNTVFDGMGSRNQQRGLYGTSGLYTEGNISNVEFTSNLITNCYVSIGLVPISEATNVNIKVNKNHTDGRLFFHPNDYSYEGTEIKNNVFTRLNLTSPRNDLILTDNSFIEIAPPNNLLLPEAIHTNNWNSIGAPNPPLIRMVTSS